MIILANLTGIFLIGLIVWWFWIYQPRHVSADGNELVVIVDHGIYSPAHIKLARNQPATLTFLRKDPSPCAEVVMIPGLEVNQTLPLETPVSISIPALEQGEFDFHCQMQMYRGKISVG